MHKLYFLRVYCMHVTDEDNADHITAAVAEGQNYWGEGGGWALYKLVNKIHTIIAGN